VERVRLGDKYNIDEWISSARTTLLGRSQGTLSAEEAEVLGFKRVAALYEAKCSIYLECLKKAGQSTMNEKLKGNPTKKELVVSKRNSPIAIAGLIISVLVIWLSLVFMLQ
jgi:hypothetical protein